MELRVELRKAQLPFEARAKYICHLIADAYSFTLKYTRFYDSSYTYIKLPDNPVKVGIELSPKHKKLPMIKSRGIVLPNGEVHLWNVQEPKSQPTDSNYQDFDIPGHWFYDSDPGLELKEGIAKWNALSREEKMSCK